MALKDSRPGAGRSLAAVLSLAAVTAMVVDHQGGEAQELVRPGLGRGGGNAETERDGDRPLGHAQVRLAGENVLDHLVHGQRTPS